ncbi:hypothetical protein BJX99DRAFT_270806 [Aspergillus californicus]
MQTSSPIKSPILQRVFPGVRVTVDDDWFGVTDPQKRRTLQNRLNQRSRRERRRAVKGQKSQELSPPASTPLRILDTVRILGPTAEGSGQIMRQLESIVITHAKRLHDPPLLDLRLSVTRLNVLRALNSNLQLLGYSPCDVHDDAQSRFTINNPPQRERCPRICEEVLPPALRPTIIQRTVPHHPWLDLIPFPQMRDTLILAQDWIDDEQLCHDMCGHRAAEAKTGFRDLGMRKAIGETGMLVWQDPWDPSGWEVTETFVRLWGWTLYGCWDLVDSTNAWRARRGEGPLSFDGSGGRGPVSTQ